MDAAFEGQGSGRRRAFDAVWAEHHVAVHRLALHLVGDPGLAEDLVADAFARTWPRWRSGLVADPLAYLRRAVVNGANDRGRRLKVERLERRRVSGEGRGDRPIDDAAADADQLLAALRTLPPRQRAVVALRFYDDLTEAAIADQLGMRPGTVKSSLSRALERLRLLCPDPKEEGR